MLQIIGVYQGIYQTCSSEEFTKVYQGKTYSCKVRFLQQQWRFSIIATKPGKFLTVRFENQYRYYRLDNAVDTNTRVRGGAVETIRTPAYESRRRDAVSSVQTRSSWRARFVASTPDSRQKVWHAASRGHVLLDIKLRLRGPDARCLIVGVRQTTDVESEVKKDAGDTASTHSPTSWIVNAISGRACLSRSPRQKIATTTKKRNCEPLLTQ